MIRVTARAKVNLRLAVLGRRTDGYHELETIMQSISLADELSLEPAEHSEVSIGWAEGLAGPIPPQPDIVERTVAAARLPGPERFRIVLKKRIPVGAGLGGASADAAAALLGLERLQGTDPLAPLKTESLAGHLGADVPFCLTGGVALATGIGDRITPLDTGATLWWVIGISQSALPTVGVYRRYDELVAAGAQVSSMVGSTADLISALADGELEGVAANLANDLEMAAFDLRPELGSLKQRMVHAGALGSIMTGSGSAIIGLCRDEGHADQVAARAAEVFPRVEVAEGTPVGAEVVES
ncbi:MAG: 4-(cytidine 5'-diphospho)-2-C-methyl-D-erythritol kinase [Actinomycetota bacterium]